MRRRPSQSGIQPTSGETPSAAQRQPLVRRCRPGPAEITQRIEWEGPDRWPTSEAHLDAVERLLGSSLELLLRDTE
jgi:hypothetical protein